MKIQELNSIQMIRTNEKHFGNGKVVAVTQNTFGDSPVQSVSKVRKDTEAAALTKTGETGKLSFQDYLLDAMNAMNSQQVAVSDLQEKIITNPDEVDIHDVTIAMSKAQMSLNLAQTVIDRLVSGWNEISTTR